MPTRPWLPRSLSICCGAASPVTCARLAFIHDHIDQCLDRAFKAPGSRGRAALNELKVIAKYL